MSRRRTGTEVERCSFCDKSRKMVEKLFAGPPGIYICNECIEICSTLLPDDYRATPGMPTGGGIPSSQSSAAGLEADSLPNPATIKAHLDEYVIGQERAKRVLSVAVYNHYKRLVSNTTNSDVELEKSNILLVGPTGSGKTLLARTLARILNVPFAIGDATTLTEAGYVGEDVENLLLKLVQAANYDLERARCGIVFIDEIDKIGRTNQNVSITRDVSGEGVQQALLKMLEGTVANIPPQGGRKHPEQAYIQLDTTNILFICGGTFVGLEDIIAQRLQKKSIGFSTSEGDRSVSEASALLTRADTDDILKFGMIPELIGRLPVMVTLNHLDESDLVRVMQEPRNALVRQYQKFFELEDSGLEFTPAALREVAKLALAKETGARGLRSILESLMLDAMFELPSLAKDDPRRKRVYRISPKVVRGEEQLLTSFKRNSRRSGSEDAGAAAPKSDSGKRESA